MYNNDNFAKIMQRRDNLTNGAKNEQITVLPKVIENSSKYTDFSDRFAELPRFCEHLPNEFKNAMIALKELHNTPYEFSLSALLSMANTCMHHLYDVDSYKYGVRPTSLYIMIILGTGGSKSTVFNEIKGPYTEFQKHRWKALENEVARYAVELKQYEKKVKDYENDKNLGLNPQFPTKPTPIETANYIISKFTTNGIMDALIGQGFISILTAEGGELFTGHAFQGIKQDGNRAVELTSALTKVWDGDMLSRNTKGDRLLLLHRRVNMGVMVQAAVIRPTLNNTTFQEQGFIHRILISQIDIFEKPYMSFDSETIKKEEFARNGLKQYLNRLTTILNIRETTNNNNDYELNPKVITSTDEAKIYMGDFYNQTKNIGNVGNKLERYEGFASRIHEHTIRIAATLAAFNNNDVVQITIKEAKAAVDIMNMFIDHRSKLELGINNSNPDLTEGANIMYNWFKAKPDIQITSAKLASKGPGSLRDIPAEQREKILTELLKNNKIVAMEIIAGNGRKITVFQYNNDQNEE